MAGGYKKIKPEDGKQFSKDYQPELYWTEERAIKLGTEMVEWMKEDDNLLYKDFLLFKKNVSRGTIKYLKKYSSFLTLYENSKDIQQQKLIKKGLYKETDPNFTKFILNTSHGMIERKEQEEKQEEKTYTLEELRKLKQQLEDEF